MRPYFEDEKALLERLGSALKRARLNKNQTHAELGARIGVSRWTVAKMESGDPRTALGTWLLASKMLSLLETWDGVLDQPEDPFEAHDSARVELERLRKRRAKKKKKT